MGALFHNFSEKDGRRNVVKGRERATQREIRTLASAIGIGFSRLNNKVLLLGSNFTSSGSGILVKSTFVEAVRFLEYSLVPARFSALI